ncbi:hypothetical protein OMP38_32150 [Cohnella ginsengisoli]|uniref:Uncharacterized protein n=1 Tax=Cohnella ginsengisoli TaxID=425004 RepID=A0A9X4KP30_9BACL|nr:hypothetical protein [Cohnella ginsengisoli]MDG0794964.1 hypothetical protein [Cohnella ginsengisoli]
MVVGTGSVETYSKRNIKSYLQIKRGAELETLEYDGSDSANYKFNVLEGSSVVGAVYVESTSELVELASGPTGITVHPLEEATESTEASLVFHVKEGDKEVGKWTLPIIMDETAPTLSGSVYENGKFTITASEPLSPFGYSTSMMFSQSGDDSDYTVVDNTNAIYSVAIVGNQAIISLNEEAIRGRYTLQPNSKFKVNVAISDYADNSSNLNSTLSMPQA